MENQSFQQLVRNLIHIATIVLADILTHVDFPPVIVDYALVSVSNTLLDALVVWIAVRLNRCQVIEIGLLPTLLEPQDGPARSRELGLAVSDVGWVHPCNPLM